MTRGGGKQEIEVPFTFTSISTPGWPQGDVLSSVCFYLWVLSVPILFPSTASDDTDEPQHFIRSDKIVPHSFVHFAEQVKLGGAHQFHNTSAAESKHQDCIQLAGTRVRKYNELNITEVSMLDYTLDIALFDEIALMVEELGASLSKHYFKTLHRNTIYDVSLKIYSENTTSEHDL